MSMPGSRHKKAEAHRTDEAPGGVPSQGADLIEVGKSISSFTASLGVVKTTARSQRRMPSGIVEGLRLSAAHVDRSCRSVGGAQRMRSTRLADRLSGRKLAYS